MAKFSPYNLLKHIKLISDKKYTCAIARSVSLLGDKWSLLILRDMILHKKSSFKEFRNSKEKIATNILTNRLISLTKNGFIKRLDPLSTKKGRRYIATDKGISALPIIMELYLFSIDSIKQSDLDESQSQIKKDIFNDRSLFEATKKHAYLDFLEESYQSIKKPS